MCLPVTVILLTFIGIVASQAPDPCAQTPCLNEGSCISGGDYYYCYCQPGFYGKKCQVSLCNEMKKATNGLDVCTLYKAGSKCVGDILNATFCECPPGSKGLFCQETYTGIDNTTLCQRQKQLYDYAMKLLNTSYTSDYIITMIRKSFNLKAALKQIPLNELPVLNCTANGTFTAVQCHVDIDDISKRTCFCANNRTGEKLHGYPETVNKPTNCQLNATCTTMSDCENGGSCINGKCICYHTYYGDRCQHSSTGCQPGSSMCRGIMKCVADHLRCNGVDDCGDSSDEENCDYTKPGKCPQKASGGMGICVQECNNDRQCVGDKKCCSNGCGHVCMKPQESHVAEVISNLVVKLNMQWMDSYAINSSYQHKELVGNVTDALNKKFGGIGNFSTVANIHIERGSVVFKFEAHFKSKLSKQSKMKIFSVMADMNVLGLFIGGVHYSAASSEKSGSCPNVTSAVGNCVSTCGIDGNCTGNMKCCSNGCAYVCMHPVDKHDPCKNKVCPAGTTCRPRKVQCVMAPCYPIAECVADTCTTYSDCHNGGSCINGKCQCHGSYYGDKCQYSYGSVTTAMPCFTTYPCKYGTCTTTYECQNGGSCVDNGKCLCFGSYYGDRCQHSSLTNKSGSCPDMTGKVGDCVSTCRTDGNCTGNMKCCSNGCGHVCMHPVQKYDPCKNKVCPSGTRCESKNVQCITTPCNPIAVCVESHVAEVIINLVVKLNMQWMDSYAINSSHQHKELVGNVTDALNKKFGGIGNFSTVANIHIERGSVVFKFEAHFKSKLSSQSKMKVFSVVADMNMYGLFIGGVRYSAASSATTCLTTVPCKNGLCTTAYICENGGSCLDNGKCLCFGSYYGDRCQHSSLTNKSGSCPDMTGKVGDCVSTCRTDGNCTGNMKCCSNGCGHVCMHPVQKYDPCKNKVCPSGTRCESKNVQCITTPCNPIAVCVELHVAEVISNLVVKLNMQWMDSYAINSSYQHKELVGNVTDALNKKFGGIGNFSTVANIHIERGSVVFKFEAHFKSKLSSQSKMKVFSVVADMNEYGLFIGGVRYSAASSATPCLTTVPCKYGLCTTSYICENGGSCLDNGKCLCFGSYYGDRCQHSSLTNKSGSCPDMTGKVGTCVSTCRTDGNCTGNMKCCSNGCGHVCMHPVHKYDPCKNQVCPSGTRCESKNVQCITTPCNPIAVCVGACNAGYSLCNNTNKCIADSLRCNGIDDCGDNSDEMACSKPCEMNCMNQGSCSNGKCSCFDSFYGDKCEHTIFDKSECKSNLDCYNGGRCVDSKCDCKQSYYGYACLMKNQTDDKIACNKTLCSNGGTCQFNRCFCATGFFGKTCLFSVHEDLDTYRKFRSDLRINMPWKESYKELSDHPAMKIILENALSEVFRRNPTFDRVEVTGFRPGSVVASYTAHFTDVIDQESTILAASDIDNTVMNIAGVSFAIMPHDDCRSTEHRCFHGECQPMLNGSYACVCLPTYQGKRCEDSVCSNFTCKYGFHCYVTHLGEPKCNCSYSYGKHCEDVPCGCNPNTQKCIFRDVCVGDQCYPGQSCVALNYTGPCQQGLCVHGDCVEMIYGGSYCKCYDNYTGNICSTKKSVCDLLPMDICAIYGGTCVGNVEDGKLCSCPYGKRGAFCERDGHAVTECQRKSDLYQTAIGILNRTITVPLISNASQIIQKMFQQFLHTDYIPSVKCMENGDYAPKQCNVNIYNVNKSNCFCVNSEGIIITNTVPDSLGYPPCTGPSVTPVAQTICGSPYSDLICLNGGSCLGDVISAYPRLCLCQEGYTGVFCQRKLGTNENAENFTRCTFSEDSFNLLQDIVNGKFQFNITVRGFTITLNRDMLFNMLNMMQKMGDFGASSITTTLKPYQTSTPTSTPPTTVTTPYWNEGDYSTQTDRTTRPTQPFWTDYGDYDTTQTDPTGWNTPSTTPPTTLPPTTRPSWDSYTDNTTTTVKPETSSGNTSSSNYFLPRATCTDDGKFQPFQCTYNMITGQRGVCYCVDQKGSVVPGTVRKYYPGLNHCKDEKPDECPKLKCLLDCDHGHLQDLKGCDICMCRKPCDGKMCGTGRRCVNETSYDRRRCHGKYSCQVPVCQKMHKPGVCPANAVATMESLRKMFQDSYHTCDITCHDDADCEGNMKCCGACGNKCVMPFAPETCFEKKEIMAVHWSLYLNMSEYLKDYSNVQMANSTYPQVLKGAMSWLNHTHVMWLPNCTQEGDYERVQCEFSVKTGKTMHCFCVNDDGLRVNRTDVMPPKYPVCETKPGMCPYVAPDVVGSCNEDCKNDFSCKGFQKCCSNNCGHVCKKPVTFTGPAKANNVNAMLALVCKGQKVCQNGGCAADWTKGKLCTCNSGWTGVTCNKHVTGLKPSMCEKRKALYQWIRNNIKKVYSALSDDFEELVFPIMSARCVEDGKHFEPMQCDHDMLSGRVKWCYCVNENGLPINGTEVDHPVKPKCGGMHCPYGNPLMTMSTGSTHKVSHFGCSIERPCPEGYMCNTLAYGKRVCCPSKHGMKDICKMTSNPGKRCNDTTGMSQQSRFYYSHYDGLCHDFTYLGCSGNENNFASKEACEKRCHRKEKPGKCPKVITNPGLLGHCQYRCADDGDCEGNRKCCMSSCGKKCFLPFNSTDSVCKNGFPLHKAGGEQFVCTRMRQCPPGYTCHVPPTDGGGHCCTQEDKPVDMCHQPSDTGPCRALMKRFFFNSATQQCEQFNYGGCQGNENNFHTLEECCNSCGGNMTRCKRGTCPKPNNYLTTCRSNCKGDADCYGKEICCYNGCGMKCTASTSVNTTYNCFEDLERAYQMMAVKTLTCNIVTVPRCNKDGSWKKQQCTDALGVCWCVDKTGKTIPGTKTRGVANCYETPDLLSKNATQVKDSKIKVCPSGKSVHCCNPRVCHMKSCPANPSAVCRVNPCGGCKVEFRDHRNNVVDCNEGLTKCHQQHHTSNMYRLQHAVNTMSSMPMPVMSNSSSPPSTVKENLPAVCLRPPYPGMCKAYMPSWFYNATSMRCEKFIYGGCKTNGNKFKTPVDCYNACNQKANPCKHVKCMDSETCKLEEKEECDHGPCDHWPTCDALFSEFHIGGVYLPTCTRDKYALRQCHRGYCWCVSSNGNPVEGTLSKGHSLVCYSDGTYVLDKDHEVGSCSDGTKPRLNCLQSCLKEVCPGHKNATCFVNMCDANCATKFVEQGKEVSCTDDSCSLISAEPSDECPTKKLCPDGHIPPECDPRSCSSMSCPNNPCAVCIIDPCSCQVHFVDLLTKNIVEDCQIVSHTLCEIETCQKYSDKSREKLIQGHSDIPLPTCSEGLFEPRQCIGEYCWCVDGFGRKTRELSEDEACIRNETVSVTVQIKFNQPFSSIKGRHAEFEKVLREALETFSLDTLLESVEFREGSIDCIMKFVDKNEMSLQLALVPDILTHKVKNNELTVQWDGEDWTADKNEILVEAEFEAQIQEREEPEEPEKREHGLDKNIVIILGVVGGAVGLVIIVGLVYFCCCRRRQSKSIPESSNDNLYQHNVKQPPIAVSNALYGTSPTCEKPEINYMPYVVEDSAFIKEKL